MTRRIEDIRSACVAAADRYYHIEKIIAPALNNRKIVLCDRYVDSSLVLQRIDNVDMDFIWAINKNVIYSGFEYYYHGISTSVYNRLKLRSHFECF